jgi:hypothetical protein
MRIPSNSTFTKEISKKFNQIFNKDMPLCELPNLQGESIMGSHVDSFFKEAKQKENNNGQETSKIAATVRQVYNERKELVGKTDSNKGKKKDFSI